MSGSCGVTPACRKWTRHLRGKRFMRIKRIRLYTFIIPLFCLLLASEFAGGQTSLKYGTAEIQKGKLESFFTDWDLCTDNSNNTAVDKQSLKRGQSYFQGFMDKHGRVIELRYYDLAWTHRWTKRFYYASNGRHTYHYFTPDGRIINHKKQEAIVRKRHAYQDGTPKEKIRRTLGDPLIIQIDSLGMEKWRYFDGTLQHWYTFNAKGELDYSKYRQ
jgi:hypothetical protein